VAGFYCILLATPNDREITPYPELLSLSVFYTVFHVSNFHGSNRLAQESLAAGKLPGSDAPLRTVYTGIGLIDDLRTMLNIFFWPNAGADNPSLLVSEHNLPGIFLASKGAIPCIPLQGILKGPTCFPV
jgi:hypothetical protein